MDNDGLDKVANAVLEEYKRFIIRQLSAEEEQMLNDLSDLTGESKSDIIRKGIKMSYNLEKYNEKGRDIF